jgi:hypothetical protein
VLESKPAVKHVAAGEVSLPKVLANSVPKAGTHLLKKSLSLLPGLMDSGIHMDMNLKPEEFGEAVKKIRPGTIATGHMGGYKRYIQAAQEAGAKAFLIIRDPRDVVVSAAYYYTKSREHYLYDYFNTRLPDHQARLMAVIQGVEEKILEKYKVGLRNIAEFYQIFTPWLAEAINCTVRFESLIGPQGGGSRELQIQEIRRMAEHLEMIVPQAGLERAADGTFDHDVPTFRRGITSDWKNHFTPQHKQAFKELAGQLLIELGYEKDMDW